MAKEVSYPVRPIGPSTAPPQSPHQRQSFSPLTLFFVSLRAFLSYRKEKIVSPPFSRRVVPPPPSSPPLPGVQRNGVKERTLEFLMSSITRLSYGANPATSRTIALTNAVRADDLPFLLECLAGSARTVVG